MFLITGLGNPGLEYEYTPHNAGFLFLDKLREELQGNKNLEITGWENENKLFKSEVCKIKSNGEVIGILQKPLTYMNLSGEAVNLILRKFSIEKFVLVHDDLDITLGNIKFQLEKSPKGHNGVMSVERNLHRTNFYRVRIGIENRENQNIPGEDYVLRKYTEDELNTLTNSFEEILPEIYSYIGII